MRAVELLEGEFLTEGDPTDHALATIASILDQSAAPREAVKAAVDERPEHPAHLVLTLLTTGSTSLGTR